MTEDIRSLYRALLEGKLSESERKTLIHDLEGQRSGLVSLFEDRDLDEVEEELRQAFDLAVPRTSRLAPTSPAEADALFAQIQSAVVKPRPFSDPQGPWWRRLLVPSLSFALGATMVLLAVLVAAPWLADRPQPGAERLKGEPQPGGTERIRLAFNVGRQEPGRPIVVERGQPGGRYRTGTDVILRFEIKKPGHVCLLHLKPDGKIETLTEGTALLKAGWHELREGDRVQAIPLGEQTGEHAFFALLGEQPLICFEDMQPYLEGNRPAGMLIDSFVVEVRP